MFESHALSICNAPSSLTSIPSSKGRILLGARVVGDWTRSLNLYATTSDKESGGGPWDKVDDRPVTVMIDGPYGGMSFDAGRYESVLLVAGGAGITFVLGVLDELVGRARKGEGRVSKVEVCWCIKSFGENFLDLVSMDANKVVQDASTGLHPSLPLSRKQPPKFQTSKCTSNSLSPVYVILKQYLISRTQKRPSSALQSPACLPNSSHYTRIALYVESALEEVLG